MRKEIIQLREHVYKESTDYGKGDADTDRGLALYDVKADVDEASPLYDGKGDTDEDCTLNDEKADADKGSAIYGDSGSRDGGDDTGIYVRPCWRLVPLVDMSVYVSNHEMEDREGEEEEEGSYGQDSEEEEEQDDTDSKESERGEEEDTSSDDEAPRMPVGGRQMDAVYDVVTELSEGGEAIPLPLICDVAKRSSGISHKEACMAAYTWALLNVMEVNVEFSTNQRQGKQDIKGENDELERAEYSRTGGSSGSARRASTPD